MTDVDTARLQQIHDRTAASSNAGTVSAISTTGHVVALGYLAQGTAAAIRSSTFRCFAGRVGAPIAGALAGSALAQAVHADDGALWVAEQFGATALAGPGQKAAHLTHQVAHSNAFMGLLAGIAVGIAVGAAVAAIAVAEIGTAGMATPLIGAAVAFGAGTAGGFVTTAIAGAGAKSASLSGPIVAGSPNVFFEKQPAARVGDAVACTQHAAGPPVIIEGSKTVFINGMPMARIGHKTSCAAVVQQGCATVLGDDTTQAYGEANAEFSVAQQLFLSAFEVLGMRSATREGGLLDGLLRKLFGEPVDVVTGDYADYRTDFEYPSVLPLKLERAYPGRMRVEGLLGPRWICSWSQRLTFADDGGSVLLEDAGGQRLRFALPRGERFEARHLKAPYYRLFGTRGEVRLHDSRSGQILVFTPSAPDLSRLSAIEDQNANRIDFVYEDGRLRRILHSDGVAFRVETTAAGLLQSLAMEGEEGPLVRYAYDGAGALTDVESLFKGEFHYGYTAEGWLARWRDSGPTEVDIRYDAQGRVIGTHTAEGLFDDRFVYVPAERRSQYVDAAGGVRTFWYNADGLVVREQDPLGQITLQDWDGLERLRSTTDPAGRTIRFDYDDDGRLTEASDWAGRSARWSYDRAGRLLEHAASDGRTRRWAYDPKGNVSSWTAADGGTERYDYDGRGRMVGLVRADGSTLAWELDARGRPQARTDALGRRTTCAYDRFGRLRWVTDPMGQTTRYDYALSPANPRGDLTHVHRPDGGRTLYAYDGEGLLEAVERAEGQSVRYAYGAFDLLRRAVDGAGHVTAFDYDRTGRLSGVTNPAGAQWRYAYDPAGRLAEEIDWAGRQTVYRRDVLGRLQVKIGPDRGEQRFDWDTRDRIVQVTTAETAIAYAYDDADRLVRAATYRAGGPDEPETEIRLRYDDKGRLVEEVQNGVAVAYRYDAAGRCIGRASPSGRAALAFDATGLLAALDSNGHRLRFGRNALGLETLRETATPPGADGPPTAFSLRQGYDSCGRLTGQEAGRDAAGTVPFGGDGSSPRALGRPEVSRRYSWDRSGRLVGVDDARRGAARYLYDPRDQVGRVERPPSPDGPGPETYRYDALMNLAQSPGGEHGYWRDCVVRAGPDSYRYDARGRMVERVQVRDGFRPRRWTYRWDGFDRLVGVTTPEGARWAYVYDAFGRRVRKERLDGEAGERVDYVWHGALVAETWRRGGNDGPPSVERWHYEPGGFRPLAKEVVEPADGEDAPPAPGRFYPLVTDAAGTPKEMFSEAGECVWRAEHALWGRAHAARQLAAARSGEAAEHDCLLRFQNQWDDPESGLHYNLNRHYDPDSGQYLSPDPIGLDGGPRTHAYVHDPLGWVDPSGLAGCTSIDTPYDPAVQDRSPEALAARVKVDNGATLYRTGTMGKSQAGEAQFWALEDPRSPGYAARYGIPPENVANADFIETGTLKPGTDFITRAAPPVGTNPGGGIEVVAPPNSVSLNYFGTK